MIVGEGVTGAHVGASVQAIVGAGVTGAQVGASVQATVGAGVTGAQVGASVSTGPLALTTATEARSKMLTSFIFSEVAQPDELANCESQSRSCSNHINSAGMEMMGRGHPQLSTQYVM